MVIKLIVSPSKYNIISEHIIDKGIDTAIIQVLRQLPRNSKIIAAVKPAAINASCKTLPIAARTNKDWSNISLILIPSGICASILGIISFTKPTTSRVETRPLLKIEFKIPLSPFWRAIVVWGEAPSRIIATSRTKVVTPLTVRTVISPILGIDAIAPFKVTSYSVDPTFRVPVGKIKLCTAMASTRSEGVKPRAVKAAGLISTVT